MDQRRWWERLLDRDSPAGPVIVLLLLILAIGFVLLIGPMLDRMIEGEKPASHIAPAARSLSLMSVPTPDRAVAAQLLFVAGPPQTAPRNTARRESVR